MTGEIVISNGVDYLQVEGGGSWSLLSIKDALADAKFWERNKGLANLLYAAQGRMETAETGQVSSDEAEDVD